MNKKIILQCIGIFFLFLIIFLGWHFLIDGFLGTDPYYHAKHSYLMLEKRDFTLVEPWIEFHFLKYAPTDLWWLYHVIQAVFIYFFGIIFGTKILTATLASLIFVAFYYILQKFKVNYAFTWTWLLFVSSSVFTTRLLLERPFIVAILFSLISFYLIIKKRYIWLFFLTAVYTLLYELSILIFLIVLFYLIAEWHLRKYIDLKTLIAASSGFLIGILLHPQSLHYLYTILVVFWQILFLKFKGIDLHIGAELQMRSFAHFLESNIIVLAFFIFTTALFAKEFFERKVKVSVVVLFMISFFWFCVSFIISRGVEYWVPFSWLFIIVILEETRQNGELALMRKFIQKKMKIPIVSFFAISVLIIFACYNVFTIFNVIAVNNRVNVDAYFKDVNSWLVENTPKNSIVFYPIWSMFPRMFFYNEHNHYITGMDPTLLYEYDSELYWIWANIAYQGIYCNQPDFCLDLSPRQQLTGVKWALKYKFNALTVVVPNKEDAWLYKVLDNLDRDYQRVYKNKELVVFKIIN